MSSKPWSLLLCSGLLEALSVRKHEGFKFGTMDPYAWKQARTTTALKLRCFQCDSWAGQIGLRSNELTREWYGRQSFGPDLQHLRAWLNNCDFSVLPNAFNILWGSVESLLDIKSSCCNVLQDLLSVGFVPKNTLCCSLQRFFFEVLNWNTIIQTCMAQLKQSYYGNLIPFQISFTNFFQ